MITIRKIIRGLTAAMPVWLVVICGVCLAIPLARLAALVCTAGLCLIQPARFRRAVSAWKGGKSHRAFDLARLSALVTPASWAVQRPETQAVRSSNLTQGADTVHG
jgi:hypothetical protein